jgi:hypothetical protein
MHRQSASYLVAHRGVARAPLQLTSRRHTQCETATLGSSIVADRSPLLMGHMSLPATWCRPLLTRCVSYGTRSTPPMGWASCGHPLRGRRREFQERGLGLPSYVSVRFALYAGWGVTRTVAAREVCGVVEPGLCGHGSIRDYGRRRSGHQHQAGFRVVKVSTQWRALVSCGAYHAVDTGSMCVYWSHQQIVAHIPGANQMHPIMSINRQNLSMFCEGTWLCYCLYEILFLRASMSTSSCPYDLYRTFGRLHRGLNFWGPPAFSGASSCVRSACTLSHLSAGQTHRASQSEPVRQAM